MIQHRLSIFSPDVIDGPGAHYSLDGKRLEGVESIEVSFSVGGFNRVRITMLAAVYIYAKIDDHELEVS